MQEGQDGLVVSVTTLIMALDGELRNGKGAQVGQTLGAVISRMWYSEATQSRWIEHNSGTPVSW